MPVRTITAEINGTQRRIQADIPEGATSEDINSAVEDWAASQPKIPGMEKLGGILPGLPPSRIPEALQGPPIVQKGVATYPPRNPLEKFADTITFGGTRKLREGLEEFNPPSDEPVSAEQKFRGTRHALEGTMQAMTPLALGSALRTIGAAPTVIRGLLAVAKPYLAGAGVGAGVDVGSQILGAGPEAGALAGEVAGAATGIGTGALRKQKVSAPTGGLPKLSLPVRLFLKAKGLGTVATAYDALAAAGGKTAESERFLFKPSEVTKRSMGTFSPYEAPEIGAAPGRTIPRKGFIPPTEAAPAAPEPFRAKPNVAQKLRFSPYEAPEISATPGTIIPRKGFTPPPVTPEAAPAAPEPFRIKPGVAQKMRYGGSSNPYSGPAFGRGGKKGSAGAKPTEPSGGSPEKGLDAIPEEYRAGALDTARTIATNRQAKVGKIVDLLRATGISPELAKRATTEQRRIIAKQAGYNDISDTSWGHILQDLRKPGAQTVEPLPQSRFESPEPE